jgi:glucose-6-phosphate-specific signal transduction histidine kinase
MKEILIAVYNWIIKSSVDPGKLSLTIRGILSGIVFLAVSFGADSAYNSLDLNVVAHDIAIIISQLGMMFSSIITIFGLVRKIYLTIKK